MRESLKVYKTVSKYIMLAAALALCVFSSGVAGVGEWKTYTNVNPIQAIVSRGSTVWCASTGGVLKIDANTLDIDVFTNTEGLSANAVTALAVDANGGVWIGLVNGDLGFLESGTRNWEIINDYRGHGVRDLQVVGDSLFIALDYGVSLYLVDRREVKEHYKKLGSRLEWDTQAVDILVSGMDIWVATEQGIAKSSLTLPNLMDPQFWTNYDIDEGIPSDSVLALEELNGDIYAGTSQGVAWWDGVAWVAFGLGGQEVRALHPSGDSLLAITDRDVFILSSDKIWRQISGAPRDLKDVTVDSSGHVWVGTEKEGPYRLNEVTGSWEIIKLNSPGADAFTGMAIDQDGTLWCASALDGVFGLTDGEWLNLTSADGLKPDGYRSVVVDSENRKWFGSAGGGITVVEEVDGSLRFSHIDTTDGRLSGSDTPSYVIVEDMIVDGAGNVWILNKFAANRKPVAVVSPSGQWQYFSIADGIKETIVTCLAIDSHGWKWIGMQNEGIVVLDDAGTPFDKSDDVWRGTLTVADGLNSNSIRSIAVDDDDVVWIGTAEGLNYWFDDQVGSRGGLLSDDIRVISIDYRNNKWIGTSGGVSVLSWDSYSWTHYSTDNSPLVNNNVQSFAFDPNTGYAFIGTENGLSRLETPFTPPKQDLSEVTGYPNPFVIGGGNERFVIQNLADDSVVRLFSVDGLLVRNIPSEEIPGSWAEWDGRNDKGDLVSSGVYLYVIYTESGLSNVGKIAVVRQ